MSEEGYVSFRRPGRQADAPRRTLYIDASLGIAGDMLLAALLDCALQLDSNFMDKLKEALNSLESIRGQWDIALSTVVRSEGRITGKHIKVHSSFDHKPLPPPGSGVTPAAAHDHDHSHGHGRGHGHEHEHEHEHGHLVTRNLSTITAMLQQSSLPPHSREQCLAAFTELALAESRVHGVELEHVHFHEVGAIDSIIDTCGAIVAMHLLGVEVVHCSALPLGSGTVWTAHGQLPVPAPATAFLLRDMAICPGPKVSGELVTPTGASLVRALCGLPSLATPAGQAATVAHRQGVPPPAGIRILAVGVGCGTKDFAKHPNVVRVMLGSAHVEVAPAPLHTQALPTLQPQSLLWTTEELVVLNANIDDMSPELLAHVMSRLLEGGALDAWQTPIVMKKGRLGSTVGVLCSLAQKDALVELLFRESSTIGVRLTPVERYALRREQRTIESALGPVQAKASFLGQELVTIKPEYEEARRLASELNVPLRALMDSL